MTTTPTQHIPTTRHILVNVADYMADGTTADASEPLTLGGAPSGMALTVGDVDTGTSPPTFTPNAATGRWVKIAMNTQSSGDVNIFAPGVPTEGVLKVPVVGDPQPNDSRVDLVEILGPFHN